MRFATLAAAFSTPLLVAAVPTKYRRAKDIDIKVVRAYEWHLALT
jgi:hypothetical protein